MVDYRYEESGLDNVVIHGMPTRVDDMGDTVYSLPNINALHKILSQAIVTRSHGITANELRFLRTEIGLTQAELAVHVKKDHQTIGRWERGEKPIDQNAELVIRLLAAERLGLDLDPDINIEEMARRCSPSTTLRVIEVSLTADETYELMAA